MPPSVAEFLWSKLVGLTEADAYATLATLREVFGLFIGPYTPAPRKRAFAATLRQLADEYDSLAGPS